MGLLPPAPGAPLDVKNTTKPKPEVPADEYAFLVVCEYCDWRGYKRRCPRCNRSIRVPEIPLLSMSAFNDRAAKTRHLTDVELKEIDLRKTRAASPEVPSPRSPPCPSCVYGAPEGVIEGCAHRPEPECEAGICSGYDPVTVPTPEKDAEKTVWCEGSGWPLVLCGDGCGLCPVCGAEVPKNQRVLSEASKSSPYCEPDWRAPRHVPGQQTWPQPAQDSQPACSRAMAPPRHGPCSGVGRPLVDRLLDPWRGCPNCPAVFFGRKSGDPTPEHRWEHGELVLVDAVEIAPGMSSGADKSGVAARAGVGLPPLVDGALVAQYLPAVPPWPEFDAGPPGSCPGVGKPLVQRYPAPSYPSCAACEMIWAPDSKVAPEHARGNSFVEQSVRRLDVWATGVQAVLVHVRRLVLELAGRYVNEKLDRRVEALELGKASMTALKAVMNRLAEVERRVVELDQAQDVQASALEMLHRAATDAHPRPGFIRGHLGKALRHLAALVEDAQGPAASTDEKDQR